MTATTDEPTAPAKPIWPEMSLGWTPLHRGTVPTPPKTNPATFESLYAFGNMVVIDGQSAIVGRVTAFEFRRDAQTMIEVAWFHNGEARKTWIEGWRLQEYDVP